MHPLGNSLPNVYSGSLGNEDMALKALPPKCDDHSEQINKAALTPDLVCSQRQRGTKASGAPRVPGHSPCPRCGPAPHKQADCICCWQVPRLYLDRNASLGFIPQLKEPPGEVPLFSLGSPQTSSWLLYAYSARKGRLWWQLAYCDTQGCSQMAGAAVPFCFQSPRKRGNNSTRINLEAACAMLWFKCGVYSIEQKGKVHAPVQCIF